MQNDEQAIRELVSSWLAASKIADVDKVLSLMTDDVVFLTPGQAPLGKAGFASGQSSLMQYEIDSHSEIQEIKVLGEWAYLWTRLSIVITPKTGGASIKRAGTTLSILCKQDGRWLLHRDANMLAVVPQ